MRTIYSSTFSFGQHATAQSEYLFMCPVYGLCLQNTPYETRNWRAVPVLKFLQNSQYRGRCNYGQLSKWASNELASAGCVKHSGRTCYIEQLKLVLHPDPNVAVDGMCQKAGTDSILVWSWTNVIKCILRGSESDWFWVAQWCDDDICEHLKLLTTNIQWIKAEYHFVENDMPKMLHRRWMAATNHEIMTFQDGMTKVDLPYFTVNASSNSTEFRFEVSGNVIKVTKDATFLSHEICEKPKTVQM